jgi:AraC-like DNA-binding protein
MLRARDAIDRDYARPLDIPTLAGIAALSEAHFIRTFRATFGETPHRYLQRRRIERAMALLRDTSVPVTDICHQVGFGSLGTFSRTFQVLVGDSPSAYRRQRQVERQPQPQPRPAQVPTCFAMAWLRPATSRASSSRPSSSRPSSFGEAARQRSA